MGGGVFLRKGDDDETLLRTDLESLGLENAVGRAHQPRLVGWNFVDCSIT